MSNTRLFVRFERRAVAFIRTHERSVELLHLLTEEKGKGFVFCDENKQRLLRLRPTKVDLLLMGRIIIGSEIHCKAEIAKTWEDIESTLREVGLIPLVENQ